MTKKNKTREVKLTVESVDGGESLVRASVSSEVEYLTEVFDRENNKWVDGFEVLGHGEGEINFSRMKDGLVIQDTHRGDQIGLIRSPKIVDGKLGGVIEFCAGSRAQEIRDDALKGLRRNMSVGYFVSEYKRAGERDGYPIFRAIKWTPYEASFVNVPADVCVGVGRELNSINAVTEAAYPAEEKKEKSMEEKPVETPAAAGVTADEVRSIVTECLKSQKPEMPAPKAVRQFDEAEKKVVERQYNICNVIRALAGEKVDVGFERECSEQIASATHKSARGFFIPEHALRVFTGKTNVNDHIVGNGAALVGTDIMFDRFIDALVAKTVFGELGVQVLNGLVGDIALPKASAMSAAWLSAEDSAASNHNPAFSQVTGTPHTIAANTILSRKLMLQTAGSVQSIVARLITEAIARGIETAGFTGSGSSGQPTGICAESGTNSVEMIAGAPTFDNMVDFWKEVAIDNANLANCKFVMGPAVKALLAKTLEVKTVKNGKSGADEAIVGGVRGHKLLADDGKIQGYDVVMSGLCDQKKIIFGDWSEMLLAFWSGVDLTVDPYTYSANGAVQLTAFQDCDVLVRNPAAFAIGTALS